MSTCLLAGGGAVALVGLACIPAGGALAVVRHVLARVIRAHFVGARHVVRRAVGVHDALATSRRARGVAHRLCRRAARVLRWACGAIGAGHALLGVGGAVAHAGRAHFPCRLGSDDAFTRGACFGRALVGVLAIFVLEATFTGGFDSGADAHGRARRAALVFARASGRIETQRARGLCVAHAPGAARRALADWLMHALCGDAAVVGAVVAVVAVIRACGPPATRRAAHGHPVPRTAQEACATCSAPDISGTAADGDMPGLVAGTGLARPTRPGHAVAAEPHQVCAARHHADGSQPQTQECTIPTHDARTLTRRPSPFDGQTRGATLAHAPPCASSARVKVKAGLARRSRHIARRTNTHDVATRRDADSELGAARRCHRSDVRVSGVLAPEFGMTSAC